MSDEKGERKIKAIIFDMDGVIVNSLKFHFDQWNEVGRRYGIEIDSHKIDKYNGMDTPEIAEKIVEEHNLDIHPAELANQKWALVKERLHEMPLFEGVEETIRILKSLGYKIGLGTSSPRNFEEITLGQHMTDLEFDAIVTDSDVQNAKPAPDIFLKCSEELGVSPGECIVVEDALSGIIAAKNGGMKAIAVTTTSPAGLFNKKADAIISNIKELNTVLIKRLEEQ